MYTIWMVTSSKKMYRKSSWTAVPLIDDMAMESNDFMLDGALMFGSSCDVDFAAPSSQPCQLDD